MIPIFRCLVLVVVGILSLAIGGTGLYKPDILSAFICSLHKWVIGEEAALRLERWMNSERYIISRRIASVGWTLHGILYIIALFVPAKYWGK